MRCRIYRWMLLHRLAAGEEWSDKLRRHLDACESCRTWLEDLRHARQRLRDEAPPAEPLPPALADRIMAAVRAEQTAPAPRRTRRRPHRVVRIVAPLAMAATLVLAVGAHVLLSPTRPVEPPPTRAAKRAALPTPGDLTEGLWGDVGRLATNLAMAEEVRRLADETEAIGASLLAHVPLDLLTGGDARWLEELIPGRPGRPPRRPTTRTSRDET